MTNGSNELAAAGQLEAKQRAALELLCSGKSVAETARTTGVARFTIYRWLKSNAVFKAAYYEWKEELKESCRGRLMSLTDKAADALERALEKGDAKAAMTLLKGLGLIEKQATECTDEEEVAVRMELEEKKRKSDLETAKRKVDLDDKYARLTDKELDKTAGEWDEERPGRKNTSVEWKG